VSNDFRVNLIKHYSRQKVTHSNPCSTARYFFKSTFDVTNGFIDYIYIYFILYILLVDKNISCIDKSKVNELKQDWPNYNNCWWSQMACAR